MCLILLFGGGLEAQVGNEVRLDDVGIDHLGTLSLGIVAPHQEGGLDGLVEGNVVQQEIRRALDDLK